VSAPLDLARGGEALSSGFNMLYTRMFLQTLKPKCLAKLERYPGLFDRAALMGARDLYAFDNVVTAPLHGYKDTDDYWHRASARHVLHDITVPTLVLNARNDPFLPGRHLPRSASKAVTLEYPEEGGHVGFAVGPFPGRIDWLPRRILDFFDGAAAPSQCATSDAPGAHQPCEA
jgi:predicted alpha/beta-fold hydrolase